MKGTGRFAGIAVMIVGVLIALFRRVDVGLVVGAIGYIIFNPSVLDKIGARRTSTASQLQTPKQEADVPVVEPQTPKDVSPTGKTNARALIAILVLGILGGSYVGHAYQNRISDRNETLGWMQDFLPAHHGLSFNPTSIWSYTLKHDGCSVTIAENFEDPDLHRVLFTYQFSLSDLDPTTIEADDEGVTVKARDARDMVHMYIEGKDVPTSGFAAIFYNKDNAEHFARALQHAVILCGGKASEF